MQHARQQVRRQDRRQGVAADQGERRLRAARRRRAHRRRCAEQRRDRAQPRATLPNEREHVWHSNKSVAANVRAGAVAKAKSAAVKPRKSAKARRRLSAPVVAKLPASLADARDAGRRRTDGRRVAARDQVRRLPDAVPNRSGQGRDILAQRQGVDRCTRARRRTLSVSWASSRRGSTAKSPWSTTMAGRASRRCKTRCPILRASGSSISCSMCSTSTATTCRE